jgi:hypothetical protein
MESVRHLNPKACDRIKDLLAYTNSDAPDLTYVVQAITKLAKTNPKFAKESLNTMLESVEKRIVKGHFNFVLRGLPPTAPLRVDGSVETVGYVHMRDTLVDFGSFSNMKILRGNVYVKFVDPESAHLCSSTLHNMQIGTHIVKAECF